MGRPHPTVGKTLVAQTADHEDAVVDAIVDCGRIATEAAALNRRPLLDWDEYQKVHL